MVTAEEAIKSDDPKVVKRARGSISTQITCDVGLLTRELEKQINGGFDIQKLAPS